MGVLIVINLLVTSFFTIFCAFYLIITIDYTIRNIISKGPKIISYWIDYFLILFSLLFASIVYICNQIANSINDDFKCLGNDSCFLLIESILMVAFLSLNNLIIDNIQIIMLCITIKRTLLIQTEDMKILNEELEKNNAIVTKDKQRHFIELFFFAIIYGLLIYGIHAMFYNPDASIAISNLHIFLTFVGVTQIVLMCATLISLYVLSIFKLKLLDRNYYSKNIKIQSRYQINTSRIAFNDDFITYKSIFDFMGNIPIILYSIIGRFSLPTFYVSLVIIIAYIIINGAILIYMDKRQHVRVIEKYTKLFNFPRIIFSFGEMDKAKLYDNNCLDLQCDENVLINELNIPLIDGDKLFEDLNNSFNSESNDYLQVNYFIILRLLYLYFNTNEFTFKEMNEEKKKKIKLPQDTEKIKEIINSIQHKFKYSITVSQFVVIPPNSDKKYSNEFNSNYNTHSSNNHRIIDFTIQSLQTEKLLSLFLYYDIQLGDIITSLDTSFNHKRITSFYNKKTNDWNYNQYITHDSLVYFEVYDCDVFSEEKQGLFSYKYAEYLLGRFKHQKQTFIPIVIGIFKISYASYKKIIVLYKNGALFTNCFYSNSISTVVYSERDEDWSIKYQQNSDEKYADKDKTIIKNKMYLDDDMRNNIKEIITADIVFIKEMKFACFPKGTIIIMYETDSVNSNDISSISDMLINNSIKFESIKEDSSITQRNDYDAFTKGLYNKLLKAKMENGSNVLIGIDLVNLLYANGGRIVFKIFFSELFRMNVDLKMKDSFTSQFVNNRLYCKM